MAETAARGVAELTVSGVDAVAMPARPDADRLRDFFFAGAARLTLGLVRWRDGRLVLAGIPLLVFGSPERRPEGWDYPIEGGLLSRGAAGRVEIRWRDGVLSVALDGYRPWLPADVYRLVQVRVHHFVTRLALLRFRGRVPPPGLPATPAARLAAAAVDVAVCTLVARRPRRLPAVLAAYHVAAWSAGGRTVGGLLFGQHVVAVDGSRATVGQALVRLAALPVAAFRLRALHDVAAETEVVVER